MFTVMAQLRRRDGCFGWKTLYSGPDRAEASAIYLETYRRGVHGNLVLMGADQLIAWAPRPQEKDRCSQPNSMDSSAATATALVRRTI